MNLDARIAELIEEIEKFQIVQQGRHRRNFRWHWLLVVLVLATAVLTTFGGILKWDHVAIAVIGVAGSALIAIHTAIAIGDKAEFQRIVATDAANLSTILRSSVPTEDQLQELVKHFTALRTHADSQLPRGGGMEAVRNLPSRP